MAKAAYKTIVVSDVHLGTKNSRSKELLRFLREHHCETLILNGDIIDGWQLKRNGVWKKKHSRLVKLVLKILEKSDTSIIYVRGNHDDFLDEFLPFQFANFRIVRDMVYESFGKRYYVCHGDVFDLVTSNFRWVAKLGDMGYTFLLWLNRRYNSYRIRRGLPYYSISQIVKHKVKRAVSFVSDFEDHLSAIARHKSCHGVIAGHIHQPADKFINGIHYLNSGDWVESMSALVETKDGQWDIVFYEDWHEQQEALRLMSRMEEKAEI
jgi:UDP-2,3-diacylglucosamine pyrophosphatase LpxH